MARRAASATKTQKKTVAKNHANNAGRKRGPSKLLKSLPESVENIEIVQQVAGILEEMQTRVKDVKQEASKELKKLMKIYEGNYKNLEKKVHQVTSEAKKQAQTSMIHILQKWHEHKEKLPAPLANEVEKIVAQIGIKAMSRKKPPAAKAAKPARTTAKTTDQPKRRPGRPKKSPANPASEPKAQRKKRVTKEKPAAEIA